MLFAYSMVGKNNHDDVPDALASLADMVAWLTVIPKDRHHQQLELPKSFVTHDKTK